MTPVNLQIQIQAMSIMAKIESLKADNEMQKQKQQYISYGLEDFEILAIELSDLAREIIHE